MLDVVRRTGATGETLGLATGLGGGRRVLPGRVADGSVPEDLSDRAWTSRIVAADWSGASLGTAAAEIEPNAVGLAVVLYLALPLCDCRADLR